MNPIEYKPKAAGEFIGEARAMAKLLAGVCKRSMPKGTPVKLFIQGEPGIGKSALMDLVQEQLGGAQWNVSKFNGTKLRMEDVDRYEERLCFRELGGGFRILRLEEVDRAHHLVLTRLLTILDDLPPFNAILCTSNKKVEDLEPRFQSRFQVFQLRPPAAPEIDKLLQKFPVRADDRKRIANFCCGNVRLALFDAQSAIDELAAVGRAA